MRRHRITSVVAATALLLTVFSGGTAVSSATLVSCDFESGTDGFSARGSAMVAVSSEAAAGGKASLFVSGRTESWNGAVRDVGGVMAGGSAYGISCNIYQNTGAAEEIKVSLQYSDSAGTTSYDQIAIETVPSGEWTKVENTAYTVPSGASELQLYVETPENLIDFYVDDVLVTGAAAPGSYKLGDCDGDKKISESDLKLLGQYNLGEISDIGAGADYNADETVNTIDGSLLKRTLITPKPDTDPIDDEPETADPSTLSLYKTALKSLGNTARLREKIAMARSGEKVTLAYIGGSITEGTSAGAAACYARKSYEYFAQRYGTGSNVNYVNAGLSGTSSVVGVVRADTDIMNSKPDVIFIEFSVNDHGETIYKKGFESLVKKCLSQENAPAVIIVITRSSGGYSSQAQMVAVANNYDLPVISVDDAISSALASGKMSWGDYGSDEYHPHTAGHKLIADFIGYYFREAMRSENIDDSYTIPSGVVYGVEYAGATMVSSSQLTNFSAGSFRNGTSNARFSSGWTYSKNGNTPMTFSAEGKGIFILFKSNQNSSLGTLNVTVNGQTAKISGNRNYAWGGPDADLAYIQDTSGPLSVSIEMASAGSDFEIFGIGVIK